MSNAASRPLPATAFVTGATGLLGNNLVRLLLQRGVQVKALVRSVEKAQRQFPGLPVEFVPGDMGNAATFAAALNGCDAVFHCAAFFRDSYKGGSHWAELERTNVQGLEGLLSAAYRAGIRQFLQVSSVAVLLGQPGRAVDESAVRRPEQADDYYRSKILADETLFRFLDAHPDFFATLVLPGWMHGPGDMGPTSAGQVTLDYLHRRLPGVVPGSFAFVDARDVAEACLAALVQGRRGERYLAAGRSMAMRELFSELAAVSGVPAPTMPLPLPLLYLIGGASELWARLTGQPVLLSLASVRLLARESGLSQFDHRKSERELGLRFRPVRETLAEEIAWYQANGYLGKSQLPSGWQPPKSLFAAQ